MFPVGAFESGKNACMPFLLLHAKYVRRQMPLRVFELFAGIGGGSLALKAAGMRTVGYCEKDPFCQAVLRSNMARGRLHSAPIFDDITTLGNDMPRADVVAGGFPCQGLSSLGRRQGLYGDHRSKLIKHVYKVIDALQPNYVFLENSPRIVRDPNYKDLLGELRQRGYSSAHVLVSASQLGAAHQRKRWFLLAVKAGAKPLRIPSHAEDRLAHNFQQQIGQKLIPRSTKASRSICAVFGNAVVPAQALHALARLNELLFRPKGLAPSSFASWDPKLMTRADRSGLLEQGRDGPRTTLKCSGSFSIEPQRTETGNTSRRVLQKRLWRSCMPTPRSSNPLCSLPQRTMTERSVNDAGNMLVSSREMYPSGKVPSPQKRLGFSVSDRFWAVHMGFPRDWITGPLRDRIGA